MKRIFLAAVTVGLVAGLWSQPAAVRAADGEGEQELFNGKDLSGWDGNPKVWRVEDGAITGETTPDNLLKTNTFLIWKGGNVADFELHAMFKLYTDRPFGNSGIQYRSKHLEDARDPANKWVVGGYQADMDKENRYTGILYEERMRGILAQRGQKVTISADGKKVVTGQTGSKEELMAAIKPGEWNEYVVTAIGNQIVHRINGKVMVEVTDEQVDKRAMEGILALQMHANKDPMKVQFKDIKLKAIKKAEGPKKVDAGGRSAVAGR